MTSSKQRRWHVVILREFRQVRNASNMSYDVLEFVVNGAMYFHAHSNATCSVQRNTWKKRHSSHSWQRVPYFY